MKQSVTLQVKNICSWQIVYDRVILLRMSDLKIFGIFLFVMSSLSQAANTPKTIVNVEMIKSEYSKVEKSLGLYFPELRSKVLKINSESIVSTMPGSDSQKIITGSVSDMFEPGTVSFVGVQNAKENKFELIALSNELNLNVKFVKIIPEEPPLLLIEPIFCKQEDYHKDLIFFKINADKAFTKISEIHLYDQVRADGAGTSTNYDDRRTYHLKKCENLDCQELVVETLRTDAGSTHPLEFKKRVETYAWSHNRLCPVERTDDGKHIYGRSDPYCESESLVGDLTDKAMLRLIELFGHKSPGVLNSAIIAFNQNHARSNYKLSPAVLERIVTEYRKIPQNYKHFLSGFLYGNRKALNPAMVRKLKESLPLKPPFDVTMLNVLAASGDQSMWPFLMAAIKDNVARNNDPCDTDSELNGLRLLAPKTKLTKEDRTFFESLNLKSPDCLDGIKDSIEAILNSTKEK